MLGREGAETCVVDSRLLIGSRPDVPDQVGHPTPAFFRVCFRLVPEPVASAE